jgi:superfamily II DNA or RNA helicase
VRAFPTNVAFRKSWRTYQQRVLDGLDNYLQENSLHVVAAPGSGKTVLGLEVVRRLNKPTLILSPSLTIRDQWIDRFISLFIPSGASRPRWITTDIRHPEFLTVATYQALHCALVGSEGIEDDDNGEADSNHAKAPVLCEDGAPRTHGAAAELIEALSTARVKTVVVDEAHHLRSEWWRTLTAVIRALDSPTVVALTATPPYDVLPSEWERYEELCGPVSAEISAPELVATGDLCAHQDYVYFSTPSEQERHDLDEFRKDVESLVGELGANQEFVNLLAAHPWICKPHDHLEEILTEADYFSSILIFLNHVGHVPSQDLLEILGTSGQALPALNLPWLEVLLTGCLKDELETDPQHSATLRKLRHHLHEIGAIEHGRVTLQHPHRLAKILSGSTTKLDSIVEIVKLEAASMGSGLRAVVLGDFIRKLEMPRNHDEVRPLEEVGIVPIFEALRRAGLAKLNLGVLTGSLIILPKSCESAVCTIAVSKGMSPDTIRFVPLAYDERYCTAEIGSSDEHGAVQLVTQLFTEGGIHVLVGTKSLLGEGWDAPAINCLILASVVGTFMLSNQMRGRAIRSLPGHPEKTANVWHLVCVETSDEAGEDFVNLERRFKAFAGVATSEDMIESGIRRLDLGEPPFDSERIRQINARMARQAADRAGLRHKWKVCLGHGTGMVEGLRAPETSLPRGFVFSNTLKALMLQGLCIGGLILWEFLPRTLQFARSWQQFWIAVGFVFLFATIFFLPPCLKALWLFIRHGSIESSLQQVGLAVARTLASTGAIKTPFSDLRVYCFPREMGTAFCWLSRGTTEEATLFVRALREVLGAVENPRYLLARQSRFAWWARRDFHPVPDVIGKKKEHANYFEKMWKRYVGPASLVFTRTIEGRRTLLVARTASLASAFQKKSERLSTWR